MVQPSRILFFADSGARVGGGHVMRCLTLARALMGRGATCAFVASPDVVAILGAFGPPGVEAVDPAEDWRPDWVVIDHYRLDAEAESAWRAPGRRLAVIDDLGERARDCDLLIDPSYGGEARARAAPAGAKVLAGPAYALVRPEFAALRDKALAHRREGGHLRHLLVSLGLTDLDGITARVVEAVRPLCGELLVDVALGAAAPSLKSLRERAKADQHLRLNVETTMMAQLTAAADLAIGAGGSSAWERAVLGLPAVTVVLADNQRPMAQAMAADGLTLVVEAADPDFRQALGGALHRLTEDATLRRSMSGALAGLCDGGGAGRVAERMLG
jgi:UDP-2,4-diacetamido-2,4,6-trideoxy-beta-L-altropyranose hydrolase